MTYVGLLVVGYGLAVVVGAVLILGTVRAWVRGTGG